MSIKRVKQVSRGPRERDSSSSPWFASQKQPERQWAWAEDVATKPEESFVPYAMTATYATGALLLHSKFGKGVVTGVEGPNIDVLFEEGPKRLRHAPAAAAGAPPAR
ncbi:MAG: hypothetical protein HYY06_02140 [Deltaproteobacteria bacterium]|nr:hypothetical protein [Deltaproteobacteria bacterium]